MQWVLIRRRPQIKALCSERTYRLSFKRAAFIMVGALLFIAQLPRPSRIVYADPIYKPYYVKQLQAIKMPSLSSIEPLQTVFVSKLRDYGTYSNTYDPGQCTWYAASRLPVPNNWGNAINWGYAAMAAGYTVSDTPQVGSVAWSITDSYLGHVAVVESVGDQTIISEMNMNGPYSMDTRPANPGEFRYIYL